MSEENQQIEEDNLTIEPFCQVYFTESNDSGEYEEEGWAVEKVSNSDDLWKILLRRSDPKNGMHLIKLKRESALHRLNVDYWEDYPLEKKSEE